MELAVVRAAADGDHGRVLEHDDRVRDRAVEDGRGERALVRLRTAMPSGVRASLAEVEQVRPGVHGCQARCPAGTRVGAGVVGQRLPRRDRPHPDVHLGLRRYGSSSALSRTPVYSESGQPEPKRFEPQTPQKLLPVPSSGRYVVMSSRPVSTRDRIRGHAAGAVPDAARDRLARRAVALRDADERLVSSNVTPPQRQLPRMPPSPMA